MRGWWRFVRTTPWVLYFYATVSMLASMLADELFAIPAVFTLLAWAFAYLVVLVALRGQRQDRREAGDAR